MRDVYSMGRALVQEGVRNAIPRYESFTEMAPQFGADPRWALAGYTDPRTILEGMGAAPNRAAAPPPPAAPPPTRGPAGPIDWDAIEIEEIP